MARLSLLIINNKKKILSFGEFFRSGYENKNENRLADIWTLARELKALWNMRVTMIPIVTGALGTVRKYF